MVLARAARAGVALALLAALAAAQSPSPPLEPEAEPVIDPENLPPTAPGLAPYFNKPKINVCFCEVLPYISCSNETAPSTWTGYDLELFKRAMPYMGWKDSMIEWCAARRAASPTAAHPTLSSPPPLPLQEVHHLG